MEAEPGATGPMNIGNPGEFTIRELVELVIRPTGSRSKLTFAPLPPDDPLQRRPDIAMARELIGWEPKVQLEEGLKKTIAFFDQLLSSQAARERDRRRMSAADCRRPRLVDRAAD